MIAESHIPTKYISQLNNQVFEESTCFSAQLKNKWLTSTAHKLYMKSMFHDQAMVTYIPRMVKYPVLLRAIFCIMENLHKILHPHTCHIIRQDP